MGRIASLLELANQQKTNGGVCTAVVLLRSCTLQHLPATFMTCSNCLHAIYSEGLPNNIDALEITSP
jgi:hypothetical protein